MSNDYYNFSVEDAYRFKSAVGAKTREKNGQLEFSTCPYCIGGAHRDKNTFAISLSTGQFECKRSSCSAKGNMITLAKDFSDVFEISKEVSNYYRIEGRAESFQRFKDAHKKIEVRDNAIKFLSERGIPEEIVRKYEVTTDPNNKDVIIFPFKDEDGALQFVKYRNAAFDGKGAKEWSIKGNYKKILFGMNHCVDFGTLVITEGQIDSLSCSAAGIKNAVSVPTGKNGFTWKPNVWNWLLKFDEIVVFGDHEQDCITLSREISGFFPKRVRIVKVDDYRGCKDANELLQEFGPGALVKAVNNAEVRVSMRIKPLTEVEPIDLSKMKSYPTGYTQIDSKIGGGFHDGEVIILTGKCGEGKSTFASMLVARMIQNGLKTFCYSGELPEWMFKSWLDYQILGSTKLSMANRNVANDFYRDKCWIYDNSCVIDEKEELFELMGQAVRDLGCKFFLIDNLMTAMEDKPQEDLFRQQSTFLGRLTKFAKGFNVIILLIAHPKKGTDTSNDAISGSGDITNRANLVFRYKRKSDKPEDDNLSLLMITKNRTTGQLDSKGIKMDYLPESMRVVQHGEACKEFTKVDMSNEFEEVRPEDMEDIPF